MFRSLIGYGDDIWRRYRYDPNSRAAQVSKERRAKVRRAKNQRAKVQRAKEEAVASSRGDPEQIAADQHHRPSLDLSPTIETDTTRLPLDTTQSQPKIDFEDHPRNTPSSIGYDSELDVLPMSPRQATTTLASSIWVDSEISLDRERVGPSTRQPRQLFPPTSRISVNWQPPGAKARGDDGNNTPGIQVQMEDDIAIHRAPSADHTIHTDESSDVGRRATWESLSVENKLQRGTIACLQGQIAEYIAQIDDLLRLGKYDENEASRFEGRIAEEQKRNEKLLDEKHDLERDVLREVERANDLEKQRQDYESQVKDLKNRIEDEQLRNKKLRLEKDRLQDEAPAKERLLMERLRREEEEKLAKKENELLRYRQDESRLKKCIADEQRLHQVLKDRFSAVEREAEHAKEMLRDFYAEKADNARKADELNRELSDVLDKLQVRSRDHLLSVTQYQERHLVLEKELMDTQAQVASLTKLKRVQSELSQLLAITKKSFQEDNFRHFLQANLEEVTANDPPPQIRRDWSGKGSHPDFSKEESIPLQHGRVLGKGANGEVLEVVCKDVKLALKRIGHRRKIKANERQEIEILKRLHHRHVIKLVGTYIQPPVLGLLLYPAAQCDLLLALDFLDNKRQHPESYLDDDHLRGRLTDHRLSYEQMEQIIGSSGELLYPRFGCIASAIAYLHANNIRHKDVKPSNILLSLDGTWITDFGMAKDFTPDLTSTSESRERGTLFYCAPEVALYQPSGRSADIFSLGCVFLEMITALEGAGLASLQSLCPNRNKSYEGNLNQIDNWIVKKGLAHTNGSDLLLTEISRMLRRDRKMRPTAGAITLRIAAIDAHHDKTTKRKFCGACCDPWYERRRVLSSEQLVDAQLQGKKMMEFYSQAEELLQSATVEGSNDNEPDDSSEATLIESNTLPNGSTIS